MKGYGKCGGTGVLKIGFTLSQTIAGGSRLVDSKDEIDGLESRLPQRHYRNFSRVSLSLPIGRSPLSVLVPP
jgi:hypothetical protein